MQDSEENDQFGSVHEYKSSIPPNLNTNEQDDNFPSESTWKSYKISAHGLLELSWIAPLIIAILFPALCVGSLMSALNYKQQINSFLPILSYEETSTTQQAAYYSQTLDFVALLVFLTATARYKQHRYYIQIKMRRDYIELHNQLSKFNRISTFVAFMSGLLMIMMGNFSSTNHHTMHTTFACSMIGSMLLYAIFLAYISYHLTKVVKLETYPVTKAVSIVVAIVALSSVIISNLIEVVLLRMENYSDNNNNQTRPKPILAGETWHLISVVLQCIAINFIPVLYLCLCRRMYCFQDWDKV